MTGKKIISCWIESDFPAKLDENLTSQIRDVKNLSATKFSDVILAALSSNIHKHFNRVKLNYLFRIKIIQFNSSNF